MQETQVQSLVWEDPLEKEMATHSSTLAWRILWRDTRLLLASQLRYWFHVLSCFVFHTIIIYYFPWGLGKGHCKGIAVIPEWEGSFHHHLTHTHTHTHTHPPNNCSRDETVKVQVTQSCPTLQPCGLYPAKLLCPWNSPGKNTGVGCHFPFQGIFPTQGLNLGLLHFCRQIR